MPIYEYYCSRCHNRFERRRPMSESDSQTACPDCATPAGRVLSVFAQVGATGSGPTATSLPAGPPAGFGGCGTGCGCH